MSVTNQSGYYLYDYEEYLYEYEQNLTGIPLDPSMDELVVPLLVYSLTFITGLVGNTLILVAVRGQTQVGWKILGLTHHRINLFIFLWPRPS